MVLPIRVSEDFERRWPGSERLATEVVINLGRAGEMTGSRVARVVRAHGVPSSTALIVLEVLDGAGGELPVADVVERCFVARSTLSGVFDTLVRHGLILRHRGVEDGRTGVLVLTARGRSALHAALLPLHQAEADWCSGLSRRERESLIDLLAKIP